jgi:enoyl-CoA hydratase
VDGAVTGASTGDGQHLAVWREGPVGRIELRRPQVVNALTMEMLQAFLAALTHWRDDPGVRVVAVTGAGTRGLCAGGDIRWVYRQLDDNSDAARRFWRTEYELDATVAEYPKPYVAIMAGIVMGGGIGIASNGSHRVVTDTTQVAMPEVRIGFVPDAGGSWLLARAPGELGTHLALTSACLGPDDAILCGLADRFVPSARITGMLAALATDSADAVLDQFAAPPPEGVLGKQAYWINECYTGDSVERILERLEEHPAAAASAAASTLRRQAPTALKLTLRLLREAGRAHDIRAALALEFRVMSHCLQSADFAEGIRAQIIDKDRKPRWLPPALAAVSDEMVDWYFAEQDPATGIHTLEAWHSPAP